MNNKGFSIMRRAKSFVHASRGIWIFFSGHNAQIGLFCLIVTVSLGFYFDITSTEWMMVVFSCGFVMVAEAFNTAIEVHMNLTSPEHHPYARNTKDIAAGAVLISVLTTFIIGILIFGHYLIY